MESFEFAVIQDLQVSLARAYDDKQALRQMVESMAKKLEKAESVAKSASTYCQSLVNEDENHPLRIPVHTRTESHVVASKGDKYEYLCHYFSCSHFRPLRKYMLA